MSAVIVGGTRGIGFSTGLELLRKKLVSRVIITGRSKPAEPLLENMFWVPMDLSAKEEDLLVASKEVEMLLKETTLEVLIIMAATHAALPSTKGKEPVKVPGKVGTTSAEDLLYSYQVNVVGPIVVTQALLPVLQRGRTKLLVNVSTRFSSISDNGSGGSAAYRISKAALNMWNKNVSVELPEIKSVLYHPGIVGTDMVANFYGSSPSELRRTSPEFAALKSPTQAAAELIGVVLNPATSSGKFYDFNGAEIPW